MAELPGADETLIELGKPITSRSIVPENAPMELRFTVVLVCCPTCTNRGLFSVAPLTLALKLLGPTTYCACTLDSPLTKYVRVLKLASKPVALRKIVCAKDAGALAAALTVKLVLTLPTEGTLTEIVPIGTTVTPVAMFAEMESWVLPENPFIPVMFTLKTCWPPGGTMAGLLDVVAGVTTIFKLPSN